MTTWQWLITPNHLYWRIKSIAGQACVCGIGGGSQKTSNDWSNCESGH